LATFAFALRARDLPGARSIAFTTLVFGELFRSFATRSPTRLLHEIGPFTNLRLVGVVALSAIVQVAIHEIPRMEEIFRITPLGPGELVVCLAVGLIPVSAIELAKLVRRRRGPTVAA